MSDVHDEGFEDVEGVLRRNHPEPTPLKLDEMEQTARARARKRTVGIGGLRHRLVTGLLVAGLTVGGGGAVVLAKQGGGDDGHGNGNHGQYCPNDQPKPDKGGCGKCPPDKTSKPRGNDCGNGEGDGDKGDNGHKGKNGDKGKNKGHGD
jgi:hypothetical protein